jgi:hypothetical protein
LKVVKDIGAPLVGVAPWQLKQFVLIILFTSINVLADVVLPPEVSVTVLELELPPPPQDVNNNAVKIVKVNEVRFSLIRFPFEKN